MCRTLDRPGRCGLDLSGQIDVANAVGCRLRRGVGRTPILLEQFNRHRRGRAKIVTGDAHVEMEFAAVRPVADVPVETADRRFRKIAESAVAQSLQRAIDGKIVDLLAPLRRTLDTAERTAHGVDFGALIIETVLHQYVNRAAQGIEAERGIVGHDRDRPDRRRRDQVPVDGVAERFVDAHPVLVDRESLGSTGDGRCDKAAKLDVRLKWIAGRVADDDARHLLLQRIRDVERAGPRDLSCPNRVDACRHLVDIHSRTGRRRGRGRIDKNPAKVPGGGLGRTSAAGWLGGCGRGYDLDRGQDLAVSGRSLGLSTVNSGNEAYRDCPD